jgi:uracil-DNA glycosylase family 4
MRDKPGACRGCALESLGRGFVPATIPLLTQIPVLGVAEAPGTTEVTQERPLVGRSGVFLDRLFKMAGLDRSEWALDNVLHCQPPGNKLRGTSYRAQAIYQCSPNLEATILKVNPKVIVAFGDTALEKLTGKTGIQRYRGFWLIGPRGIPVMPTFHPAYLLPGRTEGELRKDRPSRFIGAVLWDLLRVGKVIKAAEPWRRTMTRYQVNPEAGVLRDFRLAYENQLAMKGPQLMLTYDIETPGKAPKASQQVPMLKQPIIQIAFAFEPGWSISVPWELRYRSDIQGLLATTGTTTGWNSWNFDNPVIENDLGGPFLRGPHEDMMRAWHVLQSDLPKDLEFVSSFFTDLFPWKDLKGVDPGTYNATDGDAQIRNSYGIREALQPRGQWTVYKRLVAGLFEFLKEAGDRGLPIDVEAQQVLQGQLEQELKSEFVASQEEVPGQFYTEKVYVKRPSRTATEVQKVAPKKYCTCGAKAPSVVHYTDTKNRKGCEGKPVVREEEVTMYRAIADLDLEKPLTYITEEIGECGFNPLSVQQLAAYASAFRHLDLLRGSGIIVDGLDDTVLGHLIKRFGKGHPIYARARSIREKNKKLGTYVLGYKPDSEGRIHTTYNDNPSTLRLGSQDVNTQNVLAEIKKTIKAPPGWTFVEVDSAAIEAVMVGLCARYPFYVRLAAKGVHDYVNCKAQGIPFDAEGIRRSKSEFASARQVKKKTVHLSNYGGTPRTMKAQEPETYPTEAVAKAEQDFYFAVCPRIQQWHNEVRLQTARTHVVINDWGFHQYFYEVYDGGGAGEDFNRCIGAGPQSMAAFVMRENLYLLKDSSWRPYACANVTTHDSLALLVPTPLKVEARTYLLSIMTRPIPELDNVMIGAEAKESEDGGVWADVKLHPAGMRVVDEVRFDDPLTLSTWHRGLEDLA